MRAVRQRHTKPEEALQGELRALGLRRFTTHVAPIKGSPRRADIVFRSKRVAIFVHGCFWHSCPQHATKPKSNSAWWEAKLAANRKRDARTARELRAAGWSVLRVWEHEDPKRAAARIKRRLELA